MPAGAVEQHDGVGAFGHAARDFFDVHLHRLGVGVGQGERRADAARRTEDGAEEAGVFVTLVGRPAGPRSTPRPLADLAVLLADARLVLT